MYKKISPWTVGPHTVEKTFSCDSCEKRLSEKYHLTRHLQIHRGERPFACDECEKRFAKKYQQTKHSRMKSLINDQYVERPLRTEVFATVTTRQFIITIHSDRIL
ncbi:hypothetical protein AVEN_174934-1 [Araneus ventricosus]|uniref:C2H2-type domain-containing protein n=1 Tax=Araneus ventricosus TaxID=182803 RepID=A0A4Y2PCY0_ARAVE|nr:hypothetical protein AVEN_174934-1 [Araneus ventricosus]